MLTARAMKGEANRVGPPYCVRLKRLNSCLTNSSHSIFGPCCWVHKGMSFDLYGTVIIPSLDRQGARLAGGQCAADGGRFSAEK